ncbi:DUF937 domain-containing protein [Mycobacterium sp. M1]|uniref:DUF937 domain-containing protein n=1 Tax=Mycolicibacter acidiphilus TaxID=2835306 RepID=A0ABS5RGJ8_9MYCO|nr:DUF937 domain-containing protein [Mycolicibacter acidiphilus]MBS9533405.1 DUF937 domain-containing protein [Mycolicibacter acidiphilus]
MAGFDDLVAQIPIQDIAQQLGADSGEVANTIQTLVPVLLGSLSHNAQDPGQADTISNAASGFAAQGLLDSAPAADNAEGQQLISTIFGGNNTSEVASALSGAGAGNNDLVKKLLPILAPIVLAYIGKQLSGGGSEPAQQQAGGGGLGDILGGILGGMSGGGGGNKSMGSILGNALGGKTGEAIGGILGGLLGGKK